MKTKDLKHHIPLISLLVILLVIIGYGWHQLSQFKTRVAEVEERYTIEQEGYESKIRILEEKLEESESKVRSIGEELIAAENKYLGYDNTIKGLSDIVGDLDKLAKTDEELLQKYSKVYFLNEHYTPTELSPIDPEYTYNPDKTYEVHSKVLPRLTAMLSRAEEEGMNLKVISAYRSYGTQGDLKSHYTVTYGAGTANQFSADQGYSEHQLSTTVDFTTPQIGASFNDLENTKEYQWLLDNAHRYGFVLSYPENNSYYEFEPWHWRYIGIELATKLHEDDLNFYDMSQREIDTYLISIFD